jgi:integrase
MARKPKTRKRRTHGTGSISQRGTKWLIRFSEANGQRRARSFAKREWAEDVLKRSVWGVARDRTDLKRDPKDIPTLEELFEPWIAAREHSHRSWKDDRHRWRKHVSAAFGHLRPAEVAADTIGVFVDAKLKEGLVSTTVGHCVRMLSTFMSDVVEDPNNGIAINPVRTVRKATKKKYRVRKVQTPFLEKLDDIRRIYLALSEPYNVMFALGAMCGLRTGEVLGVDWETIDLERRRIRVVQQVNDARITPLKDSDPRSVPIPDDLMPILTAWKLHTGGHGLLFKPKHPTRGGRPDLPGKRAPEFIRPNTLNARLRKAIEGCPGVPPMGWKSATRTTFGSQFILGGGSIEQLQLLLGHEDVKTTMVYARHKVDLFPEASYSRVRVDFSKPSGQKVIPMASGAEIGIKSGSDGESIDDEITVS